MQRGIETSSGRAPRETAVGRVEKGPGGEVRRPAKPFAAAREMIRKQSPLNVTTVKGLSIRGDCAMDNAKDAGSAQVWRAAQGRRTEDLAKWFSVSFKQNERSWLPLARVTLTRGLAAMIVAFVALASVSAVVHEGKPSQFVSRATGPMPAVNVP
jgi:hypothetical protein